MINKSDNFIDVLKQAEASCEGSNARNIADFDDDLDRSVRLAFQLIFNLLNKNKKTYQLLTTITITN